MNKVSKQLNIDKSFIKVWLFKEEELGIGFFLPYHRKLGSDEVRAKYIYVESEFQGYFPPTGEKFVVMGDKGQCETTVDRHGRIFLTEWFNDNVSIKAGDIVSIWQIEPRRYIITRGGTE